MIDYLEAVFASEERTVAVGDEGGEKSRRLTAFSQFAVSHVTADPVADTAVFCGEVLRLLLR